MIIESEHCLLYYMNLKVKKKMMLIRYDEELHDTCNRSATMYTVKS